LTLQPSSASARRLATQLYVRGELLTLQPSICIGSLCIGSRIDSLCIASASRHRLALHRLAHWLTLRRPRAVVCVAVSTPSICSRHLRRLGLRGPREVARGLCSRRWTPSTFIFVDLHRVVSHVLLAWRSRRCILHLRWLAPSRPTPRARLSYSTLALQRQGTNTTSHYQTG